MKQSALQLAFVGVVGGFVSGQAQAADPPGPAPSASQLEEIVVTARRRDERLQDVPVAVTAVSGATLASAGVTTTARLAEVTPGFVMAHSANSFQPTLRGVGSNLGVLGAESPIALYLDGVYQPEQTTNQIDFVNIDRVEVLRGPQGTLFGRNASGGLINIITRSPSFTPSAEVTGRYGSYDDRSLKIYGTTGLTESLAVDVSGMIQRRDGHIDDVIRGGKVDRRKSFAARSKVLFKPGDAFSATLIGAYSRLDDPGVATGVIPTNNTVGRQFNANLPRPGAYRYVGNVVPLAQSVSTDVALLLSLDLDRLSLFSTSAYKDYSSHLKTETDGSVVPVGDGDILNHGKAYSQEFRAQYDDGDHINLTVGANGFLTKADSAIVVGVNRVVTPNIATALHPFIETRAGALFAEGTYKLTEAFNITVGGRYTTEKRHFTQSVNGRLFVNDVTTKFSKFTPRVIAQYYLTDDTNIYASYSVGFKSGIFNAQSASSVPVAPETNKAYEAGIKAEPLSTLRTNLAAFYYDYINLQVGVRDPVTALSNLRNAGAARMKGIEAEIFWAPATGVQFHFAGSYLDAKYKSLRQASVVVPIPAGGNMAITYDASGNRIIRAPRFSASLDGLYRWDLGSGRAEVSGSVYRSARVYQTFDQRLFQPAYWRVAAEIAYLLANDTTRISVSGQNLTKSKVLDTINAVVGGDIYYYAPPRTFSVSLQQRF